MRPRLPTALLMALCALGAWSSASGPTRILLASQAGPPPQSGQPGPAAQAIPSTPSTTSAQAAQAVQPGTPGSSLEAPPASDPDALYAARTSIASARAAAAIWAERLLARPGDFESAWKLARVCYWLGSHMPEGDWRGQLEQGVAAGRQAIAAEPKNPAGHFWLAATMGLLAEQGGVREGLRYRAEIKRTLETVLILDPAFQRGSADRGLGRWYLKVPRLMGGSHEKAEFHLRRSLAYDPVSAASRFFLAETLVEQRRRDEARSMLQAILETPLDPEWGPEDREFKMKATALLARLGDER